MDIVVTETENSEKPYFTKLPNRGLLMLEGEERHDFLQKLISNDITLLKNKQTPLLYACLLSPQGKFLHDFFIREAENVLLIECEGGACAEDLYKRLMLYRLRAKVQISLEEYHETYALWGDLPENMQKTSPAALQDPRHKKLGARAFEKPEAPFIEKPFEAWDEHRIKLCVPDGSRDMMIGETTLAEAHIDILNGVSYSKGCYPGQELTARMHHRGLAKKHLYTLKTQKDSPFPQEGAELLDKEGNFAGTLRSKSGLHALALLKDSSINSLAHFKPVPYPS